MTRLAILADIHGNRLALDRVVADMDRRGVDAVINLGDCVSGPLWPRETLDLLRETGWPTIRGNHDRWVGDGDPASLEASDLHAWRALDAGQRRWLLDRPTLLRLDGGIVAMHACPSDDNAYLLEQQQGPTLVRAGLDQIRSRLAGLEAAIVLTAHSHLPTSVAVPQGPLVINPGSVGCPAYHDDSTEPAHVSESGSPSARYAIADISADGVNVEFLSLAYDHEAAARRAAENGRQDWAFALTTGFARPATESFA